MNKEEGLLDSRSNATGDFPALKGFSSTKGFNQQESHEREKMGLLASGRRI